MDTEISEEEIAKYRLPECFEYFEEAPVLQYVTVRLCLNLFGPSLTRTIAEYLEFEKSKYPVYTDEQIRQLIKRTKPIKPVTPIPKRLMGTIEEQIATNSLPIIIHTLESDQTLNLDNFLEDMRIYILKGELARFLKLDEASEESFTHNFNDIYLAFHLDNEPPQTIKQRLKALCAQYTATNQTNCHFTHIENSAFVPYSRSKA